jgi:hypothetical protein
MKYTLLNNNKTVKSGTTYKLSLTTQTDLEIKNIFVSCGCMSYKINPVTKTIALFIAVSQFPKHISGNTYQSNKSLTITFSDSSLEKYKINYNVTRN